MITLGQAALALCVLLCGCRSAEERALEAEVAALDRKIDALRAAPNDLKGVLLQELEREGCERAPVCELKLRCVEAYRAHLAAVAATSRARSLLGSAEATADAPILAARELVLADERLATSKAQAERCASEQGELRRRVRAR